MKAANYHIIEIDEQSYMKTPSGLFYFVEGLEYDKYQFTAKMFLPCNDKYAAGQEVFVLHFALDRELTINGKKYRAVLDEDIVYHKDADGVKSHNFILADKTYTIETALGYDNKKEQEGVFKVTFSNTEGVNVGDEIAIYIDTDYPIPFSEQVAILPQYVTKNLTTNQPLNDYIQVSPLTDEGFTKKGGVLLANKDLNKGWGQLGESEVLFKKMSSTRLPSGDYMVKKEDIYATR